MNNPRPQEEELFDAAQRLTDPDQRKAFLDAACAKDPTLRRRLDELFAAQQDAEQFFKEGVGSVPAGSPSTESRSSSETALVANVTEKPGDRIGRYKLLQKVGQGGCGVVYMAEQEEPVRRRVALKVIKLGMDPSAAGLHPRQPQHYRPE